MAVFGAEVEVIPQPLFIIIVPGEMNGLPFKKCNKSHKDLRQYIEH